MDNTDFLSTLLQKAKGYKEDETTREYQIDDTGEKKIVKEKVVTKYYPPDTTALKTYLDMEKDDLDLSSLTEKQLYEKSQEVFAHIKEVYKTLTDKEIK